MTCSLTRTLSGGRGRPRTPQVVEDRIRALWATTSTADIASLTGVSFRTVQAIASRLGLPRRKSGRKTKAGHGTRACYNGGCRRPECRQPASDYIRDYKWATRTRSPRHGPPVIAPARPRQYRCECGRLNCPTHTQPWMAA